MEFVFEDQAYCLAFSEPEHGSDLASVETRAEIRGGEIVVTGIKTWIAHADQTSAVLVLCRTEPTAPRFQNLSCVLVPLHDNSVELRPIRQMSGDSDLFEVCFDGARAPLQDLIGGRGNGWQVAMTALAAARKRRWLHAEREFWELVETARHNGRNRDPLVRQQLAWAYAQVQVIGVRARQYERCAPPLRSGPPTRNFLSKRETELLTRRPSLSEGELFSKRETELLTRGPSLREGEFFSVGRRERREASNAPPGDAEDALLNVLWSEYHRRFGEIAMEITGADGLVRPDGEAYVTSRWQHLFLTSRADTIAAGTSETQRTIIAERMLGLPK